MQEKMMRDDLISRQAAIDILDDFADNALEVVGGSYETARRKMCGLPSAKLEIIRCDECRYYIRKSHRCEPLGLITCDGFWCKQAERRKDG